jgi:hypothetical protein
MTIPMNTSSTAGVPHVVEQVFVFGTDLLGFLPAWLGQLIVAAILLVLGVLLVNWFVRHAMPWLGGVLAIVLSYVVRAIGYVLLVLEYVPTRLLRAIRQRPPAPLYAYGALVARGTEGCERAVLAGIGATKHLQRTPKWMLVVTLMVFLASWNQAQCGSGESQCHRPVDMWRTTTADWFRTAFHQDGTPCPAASGKATVSCKPSHAPASKKATHAK